VNAASAVPPRAKRGEGDQVKPGGGVTGAASPDRVRTIHFSDIDPSTTLRVVPLPIVPMGRNLQDVHP